MELVPHLRQMGCLHRVGTLHGQGDIYPAEYHQQRCRTRSLRQSAELGDWLQCRYHQGECHALHRPNRCLLLRPRTSLHRHKRRERHLRQGGHPCKGYDPARRRFPRNAGEVQEELPLELVPEDCRRPAHTQARHHHGGEGERQQPHRNLAQREKQRTWLHDRTA